VHYAVAFAEDIHGADSRTTQAQNVGIEDGGGGASEVAGRDLFDEARHVDVSGAGGGAGRIETEEAAIGFGHGGLGI